MDLIALRNFMNVKGHPRGMIQRGETFTTNEYHGKQLIEQGIAAEAGKAAVDEREKKVIQPERKETGEEQPATKEENGAPQETAVKGPSGDSTDFESYSYQELKQMAKSRNVKGYQNMKKKDLIQKLKGDENNG